MIHFYCGINEQQWNHHPVSPGPLACVAPVYGKSTRTKRNNRVKVPAGVQVIQDSGAFSDRLDRRLSFEAALDRQIAHAETFNYAHQITYRASYDVLIDEKWEGGTRHKERWSEQDGETAANITVEAARYLTHHRHGLKLILSAQGVTTRQYMDCTKLIIPLMEPGDVFGLGGFCITGMKPKQIMPVFRQVIQEVIPLLGKEGIKQIHIWGVCYAPALGELLWLCDQWNITLSTDSAGASVKPARGQWGYAEWIDRSYQRPPASIRGLERARHVEATRIWLRNFRQTSHYKPSQVSDQNILQTDQLALFAGMERSRQAKSPRSRRRNVKRCGDEVPPISCDNPAQLALF